MIVVDPSSEILRQLTRIADAASVPRPSLWTEWAKTIATFIAGIISAYLVELLKNRWSDSNERGKMRKIVYYELGRCFLDIHCMICTEEKLHGARYGVFKDLCPFDGEAYMKKNPAVFYGLQEGQVLANLYYWFHKVDGGGAGNPRTYGITEMKAPLRFFSDRYRKYPILKRNFRKVLDAEDFAVLDRAVEAYKSKATLEEWVDSGLIELVELPPK